MGRKHWSPSKLYERLLQNKSNRTYWANISELRKRSTQEIFDRAVLLTQSDQVKERIIGVDVLAQLGNSKQNYRTKAVPIFFQLLEKEKNIQAIQSILSAISHNNQLLSEKQVVKLISLRHHRYSDVRFNLTLALGGVEHAKAIKTMIELSSDKHPVVRDYATFGLASLTELDTPAIRKALWARLNDHKSLAREEAILGLAIRKDADIKPILIQDLEKIDNHGSILLESIQQLGDKSFIPLLEQQVELNRLDDRINPQWLLDCIEQLNQTG